MTDKIPDDVVERACDAYERAFRHMEYTLYRPAMRAAIAEAVAAEREACAAIVERGLVEGVDENNPAHDDTDRAYNMSRRHATADIRARGE